MKQLEMFTIKEHEPIQLKLFVHCSSCGEYKPYQDFYIRKDPHKYVCKIHARQSVAKLRRKKGWSRLIELRNYGYTWDDIERLKKKLSTPEEVGRFLFNVAPSTTVDVFGDNIEDYNE